MNLKNFLKYFLSVFFCVALNAQISSGFTYKNDYDMQLLNTEEIKTDYSRTWMENGEMNFELKDEKYTFFSTEYAACDEQKDFSIETEIQALLEKGKSGRFGMVWGYKKANNMHAFELNEANKFRIYTVKNSEHIDLIDWTETELLPEAFAGKIKLSIRQSKGVTEFYINGKKKFSCPSPEFFGNRFGYVVGGNMKSSYLYIRQNEGKFDMSSGVKTFLSKEHIESGFDKNINEINPVFYRDQFMTFTAEEKNRSQNTETGQKLYSCKFLNNQMGPPQASALKFPENELWLISYLEEEKKAVFFSMDKNEKNTEAAAFYRCVTDGNNILKKNQISFVQPTNSVKPAAIHFHALNKVAFSRDKKHVIFSADVNRGLVTQADLFAATVMNDSTWTYPELISGELNTAGDELYPFVYYDDKTLYFSSTGHTGYGHADIYVSHRTGDNWTQWSYPENLGNTVNGPAADLSFYIPEKGEYAYMSGTYEFWNNLDLFKIKLNIKKEWKVYGNVLYAVDKKPLPGSRIKILDPLTGKMIDSTTAGKNGEYVFLKLKPGEYQVVAESGILSTTLHLSFHENESELNFNILVAPFESGQTLVLKNISFEPNRFELLSTSFNELDKLAKFMNDHQEIKIEIHGHTSTNNEGEKFNIDLSTKRAAAVEKYLEGKGIKTERMTYKGFGYNEPIYKGTDKEEQARNRRVEIIFIK